MYCTGTSKARSSRLTEDVADMGEMTGSADRSTPGNSGGTDPSHLHSRLLEIMGASYSSGLGIDLAGMESDEIFKWFLASLLIGSGVGDRITTNTYRHFEKVGALSPEVLGAASPADVLTLLERGGYAAPEFRVANTLLQAVRTLNKRYEGDLNRLHFFADDEEDLQRRLRRLARGIGPVTLNIFLRELRGLWEKAEPPV